MTFLQCYYIHTPLAKFQALVIQSVARFMHTKSTLCNKNNFSYPKVGYIKHLHHSVWKVFIRRHYLDKLKIEKNFYLSFFPKIEKWT